MFNTQVNSDSEIGSILYMKDEVWIIPSNEVTRRISENTETSTCDKRTLSEMLQFPEWLEYPQLAKLEDNYRERERERELQVNHSKKNCGYMYICYISFVLYAKSTYISVDYQIRIHEREDTLKYLDEDT